MNDCLFCKIISGEIPSSKIYENEHTYAFLDIKPTNRGHTLVVPKEHSTNIHDISEESLCMIMKTVKKLAPIIKKAVNANGINIIMNSDSAAGQIIFHAHVHIVPRFTDDGFRHWKGTPCAKEEMDETAKQVTNLL